MDWLIALGLLAVLAPLLMYLLATMGGRDRRRGGGGAFIALDQVFDPAKRHLLEVPEERMLGRENGEPPPPGPGPLSR